MPNHASRQVSTLAAVKAILKSAMDTVPTIFDSESGSVDESFCVQAQHNKYRHNRKYKAGPEVCQASFGGRIKEIRSYSWRTRRVDW